MSWTPTEPIIRIIERETPQVITFSTSTPSIVAYQHVISPAPPPGLMSIADSPAGVTVSWPLLDYLFPIQYVDYVTDDNVVHRVSTWAEVPESGVNITNYRPDQTITLYTFSLQVIAINNLGATFMNSWQIDINNDWRVERERFLERLNASA